MSDELVADEKRMRLQYAGVCRVCKADLPARNEAIYERSSKTVRCLTHDEAEGAVEVEVEMAAEGGLRAPRRKVTDVRADGIIVLTLSTV